MPDKLTGFLAEQAGRTVFENWRGVCGLWLADWYVVATGNPDPAAEIRHSFFHNVDLPYTVRAITKRLGLKRTSAPQRGDIGLISIAKGHLVGAIFNGWHWIVLAEGGGLCAVPPNACRFNVAWRIE